MADIYDFKEESMLPAGFIENPKGKYADYRRVWQGIPTIERTRGGRILACWYSGGKTEEPGNFLVAVKSEDGGRSFSPPLFAVEPPTRNVRCFDPCLWLDPYGKLWLFYAQSCLLMDGRGGVWAMVCHDPDAPELIFDPPRRIANGIMMNKPTVLSSGEWLMPCAIWNFDASESLHNLPDERYSNVYRSADGGETFALIGHSAYADRWIDEHMLVERRDGSLWMLIRARGGIGQAFSYDKGVTWEGESDSGLGGPCSRFCIRRLRGGNLILVNHHDFKGRNNLKAMLSRDDGTTWEGFLTLDGRADVSYPDIAEDGGGNIYIIYDRSRYADREILMAKFTEADILAGKIITPGSALKILVNRATGVKTD